MLCKKRAGSTNKSVQLSPADVARNPTALEFATDELRANREVVLAAATVYGCMLKFAAEELRADKEIVLKVVTSSGDALEFATAALQADREVVLAAVATHGVALEFASLPLQADRDVVLRAVTTHGCALRYASKSLQDDKELVLAAALNDGDALKFADARLQADKEVVLAALNRSGGKSAAILSFAAEGLRADRDVILKAVVGSSEAVELAAEELKSDREFICSVVMENGNSLKYVADIFQQDVEIVLAAITHSCEALSFASAKLRDDHRVVRAAVEQSGYMLKYASERLRAQKELVLIAVKNRGDALMFAAPDLQADKDMVMKAVAKAGFMLKHVSDAMRADRDVVFAAVQESGDALQFATDDLRNDVSIVQAAVAQAEAVRVLTYAGENLRNDLPAMQEFIRQDPSALKFVGKSLRKHHWQELSVGLMTVRKPLRAVFSVRFGFSEAASDISTAVHIELESSEYFRDVCFYNPNIVSKGFCGPHAKLITSQLWPCRGKCFLPTLLHPRPWYLARKSDKVTDEHCWRFSFYWQLQSAKSTGGFMVQIVEYRANVPRLELGKGQEIEFLMAQHVGIKLFRLFFWNPLWGGAEPPEGRSRDITESCIAMGKELKRWQDGGCSDQSLVEIIPDEAIRLDKKLPPHVFRRSEWMRSSLREDQDVPRPPFDLNKLYQKNK